MLFVTVLQTMNIKLSISTENILEQKTTSYETVIYVLKIFQGVKNAKTCAKNTKNS